jgi:endonuclease-3
MRNKRNPPRQPLARARPKSARSAKVAAKSGRKASRAAGVQAPPPGARGAAKKRTGTPRGAARRYPPAAQRAPEIYALLHARYPDARCALHHETPFQLLVATILSAQCTDKRVNMVTPSLFARYPGPASLAAADPAELEEIIRSTGFFRAKAKSLIGMATALTERHGEQVPPRMEDLVKLPGVGRKTANVVLGNAFGRDEGIVVDTHVTRVSQRLALTRQEDPVKIEQDLMTLFPRDQWTLLAHLFIEHGRQICDARRPRCEECPISRLCPSSRV